MKINLLYLILISINNTIRHLLFKLLTIFENLNEYINKNTNLNKKFHKDSYIALIIYIVVIDYN